MTTMIARLVLLGIFTASFVYSVHCEAVEPNTVGGLNPTVPVVPFSPPRDFTDDAGWSDGAKRSATSSFVESLKPSDAALEVIVGQSRLLTTKGNIDSEEDAGVVGIGDPSVLEFDVMPNPRMLRLLGLRVGVTDLSITLASGETHTFEVHVVYDLDLMTAQLRQIFPDADLKLAQLREHVVVEGQARSAEQVAQIIQVLESYVASIQVPQEVSGESAIDETPAAPRNQGGGSDGQNNSPGDAEDEVGGTPKVKANFNPGKVINLIRVPGVQQVMLQVRIAELNRTAIREMGAQVGFGSDGGRILGTNIGGGAASGFLAQLGVGGLAGDAVAESGSSTTAFGIFPGSDLEVALNILRQNSFLRILAEPNLISLSGHKANFLAGGEFPVPVPQGGGGGFNNTTIQFREFGVRLDFVPYVVEDDVIRLSVMPEVSALDPSLSTTLVDGGDPVPGLSTRRAATTVELREGHTLAIAGLLQVELSGRTGKLPGLGDLPYLGPFFSNNNHKSVEKELLVLVTPHLIAPLQANEMCSLPGDEILEPTDKEFYFMGRIEGRTGAPHRSTTDYEPINKHLLIRYEQRCMRGPCGYSR